MGDSLSKRLEALAVDGSFADGTPCRIIPPAVVISLAEEIRISGRVVEITALEHAILPARYLRNMKTLSVQDQIRLLQSTVCVVGLGGLGGAVTENLARLGVGRLHLIDGDRFEAHDLNRQLLSNLSRLGQPKSAAAATRVKAINPGIEVVDAALFLTDDNADALIHPSQLVVDCLDSVQSRRSLAKAAKKAGIPMVSAAIAGISGHVTTIFPEDRGVDDIYGPQDDTRPTRGAELELGCLAPAVNLIAALECSEVLKLLLAKAHVLRNRLLVVDLNDYTMDVLQLA